MKNVLIVILILVSLYITVSKSMVREGVIELSKPVETTDDSLLAGKDETEKANISSVPTETIQLDQDQAIEEGLGGCFTINDSNYSLKAKKDCQLGVTILISNDYFGLRENIYSAHLYLSENDEVSLAERIDIENECKSFLERKNEEGRCFVNVILRQADTDEVFELPTIILEGPF